MAILIDPPEWPAHGTLWSHLVSDAGYDELHEFAAHLRLPRRSFDLDHYDVPAHLHAPAIDLGAYPVSGKEVVRRLRTSGLRVRQADRAALRPVRRHEYLRAEWARLGDALGIATLDDRSAATLARWQHAGDTILSLWNEPHRRYHDVRHLEDVLLALDQLFVNDERIAPVTLLAAWFHDAAYSGSPGHDEAASARLAQTALREFGLATALLDEVGALIIATVPARAIEAPSDATAHLLDADLAIFAAGERRYAEYAAAVRAEYAHVDEADFRAGRAQILHAYLAQPTLYRTLPARQLWEARARANVTREVASLTA